MGCPPPTSESVSVAASGLELSRLDGTVQSLLTAGIAPSTAAAYRSGVTRFLAFCRLGELTPFPLSESTLCRFVAYLFDHNLSSSSIRLYLSALRFFQILQGLGDPSLSAFVRLHYVLRGISRAQPRCSRPVRLPITIDVLESLFQVWAAAPPQYEFTMLWAACTLGFFAFLRSGEFTSVPGGNHATLTPADVQVDNRHNPSFLAVTLRQSKTDPFGAGCTLYIGRSGSHICPVHAVLAYLAIRPSVPGPLFLQANGSPLTRSDLVTAVRAALSGTGRDLSRFTGHSFRIGAATAAAHAGLPDSLIQTLGRWRSSAFLRYIRTPTSTLLAVSRSLVQQTAAVRPSSQP